MLAMKHEATHSVEVVVCMPITVRFKFDIRENDHTLTNIKAEARIVAEARTKELLKSTVGSDDRILTAHIGPGDIESMDVTRFKFEELNKEEPAGVGAGRP